MDFMGKNDEIVGLMALQQSISYYYIYLFFDKLHTLGLLFAEFLV